jgi:tetratricopeptide (TPR) repeat protein
MLADRLSKLPVAAVAFVFTLALAWCSYRPGLTGAFVFDDFVNLPVLGYYGPVDNWTAFWLYLTSGSADPTGRPLAMLSFLLDANDWPADPYAFKRTGVLLHLLNGALLTWLLLKIGRAGGIARPAAAAVLGAALWLLHPFLVSTTLYVVQRETILAASFVLLGLLGYVAAREQVARGRRSGVWFAAIAILGCTLLATLCKANGALLPLLALIVEFFVLAPREPVIHPATQHRFARMRRLTLVLPALLMAAFLAYKSWSGFVQGVPAIRSWTLGERLLTEARILVGYLSSLWLPHAYSPGLFNDSTGVSSGLLSPPTTLACIFTIAALLAAAWRWRKRHAAVAAAIFFFFAGHLLESSVVPLELYFEHRNYLPSILLFWPLAIWICGKHADMAHRPDGLRALRATLAVVLPLGLAGLTYLDASLWGNVRDQMLLWAARNPDSPRAQVTAAQVELEKGQVAAATARLQAALQKYPDQVQLALNLVSAKCASGGVTAADIEATATALRTNWSVGRVGSDWFDRAVTVATEGTCPGLTLDALDHLLDASEKNPRAIYMASRFRQDSLHLRARLALLKNDDERALVLFDAALDADPNPAAALSQAALLGTAQRPQLALRHLDHLGQIMKPLQSPGFTMQSLHAWLLFKSGYWDGEIAHLRQTLTEDVAEQATRKPVSSL